MLNERKLTERELDKRIEAIKGLLSNKRSLVKKYGKDAEKVMYGIATKQAKKKIEDMNLDNLKELIKKSIQKEAGTTTVDTGFSGRADYGEEDRALGREDELEMTGLEEAERAADRYNVNVFGYQTQYYRVCPAAKAFMDKVVAGGYGDMSDRKNEVIRMAKLNDLLFKMELRAVKDANYAKKIVTSGEVEYIADTIQDMAENLGIPKDDVKYVDNHVEIIFDAQSGIKENMNEEDEKEPSKDEISKNKGLAKTAEELAKIQSDMRTLARDYSKAKGMEKEILLDKLKAKTKLKKELENILDKKI